MWPTPAALTAPAHAILHVSRLHIPRRVAVEASWNRTAAGAHPGRLHEVF
eukprot:CAMPEP_0185209798 /NCGR_PEP_ID=MMETSP1140-20130426/64427_1 /TAXON_ID=298111 /ORGANISM="Pavlova sp., Strain CCMP459" /LENGTH=49 /DNA_ID=CAMNT_0027777567 /DNA_START=246 /DNA_END=395 /DNA_ORIENTATION=-